MSTSTELGRHAEELRRGQLRFRRVWLSSAQWFAGALRENSERKLILPIEREFERQARAIDLLAEAAAFSERLLAD